MAATDLVNLDYTNHRGERAARLVRPIRLWFGSSAWHREPQWLLECFDVDKRATRDFALAGIHSWKAADHA
jgi:predicted DNA-binding transcriptional regulator YafY